MRPTATDESGTEPKKRDQPPPLEFLRPGEGQAPLPPRDQPPAAWVPRPEEFERPAQTWGVPPPPRRAAGGRAKAAGICLILAALVGILTTVYSFYVPLTPEEQQYVENITANDPGLANTLIALTIISFYAQGLALLGGVLAFRGREWKLATACAVLSLASLGFYFIASAIGFLGLMLVLSARGEFTS